MTAESVFSPEIVTRRKTLGQLTKVLRKNKLFLDDFEDRIDRFVENRNRFAHRLFVEIVPGDQDDHVARLRVLSDRKSFMLALLSEASELGRVFRGLFVKIGVTIDEQQALSGLDHWLDDWRGDLQEFVNVQRDA